MIGKVVKISVGHGYWGYKGIVERIADKSHFSAINEEKNTRYVVKLTAPRHESGHIRIFPATCLSHEEQKVVNQ